MTHTILPQASPLETQADKLQDFPLEQLTPRIRKEAEVILDYVDRAFRIGRKRADIRHQDENVTFRSLKDIDPITVLLFSCSGISITQKTLPAAAEAAMGYETPAVVILQAEWTTL